MFHSTVQAGFGFSFLFFLYIYQYVHGVQFSVEHPGKEGLARVYIFYIYYMSRVDSELCIVGI